MFLPVHQIKPNHLPGVTATDQTSVSVLHKLASQYIGLHPDTSVENLKPLFPKPLKALSLSITDTYGFGDLVNGLCYAAVPAGGIWNGQVTQHRQEYHHCVCGQQQPAAGSLISHNAVASALPIYVCLVRIVCMNLYRWPYKDESGIAAISVVAIDHRKCKPLLLTRPVATCRLCDGFNGGNLFPYSKLLMRYRCSEQRQFLFHYFYSPSRAQGLSGLMQSLTLPELLWFTHLRDRSHDRLTVINAGGYSILRQVFASVGSVAAGAFIGKSI
jgi:hypothetical protein